MKTMPIEIRDGVLRLPVQAHLPAGSRLAVIVMEEVAGSEVEALADAGGAFEFLHPEPDLYSDADILPDRRNPRFGGKP